MLATLTQSAQSQFTNTVQFLSSIPRPYWKRAALSVGLPGSTLDVQSLTQEIASAQRGEVVPTTLGIGAGIAVAPVLRGAMAMGISTAAAAIGISIPGIGTLAWLASLYPDAAIGAGARNTVRAVTDLGKQVRHLEFGGLRSGGRVMPGGRPDFHFAAKGGLYKNQLLQQASTSPSGLSAALQSLLTIAVDGFDTGSQTANDWLALPGKLTYVCGSY